MRPGFQCLTLMQASMEKEDWQERLDTLQEDRASLKATAAQAEASLHSLQADSQVSQTQNAGPVQATSFWLTGVVWWGWGGYFRIETSQVSAVFPGSQGQAAGGRDGKAGGGGKAGGSAEGPAGVRGAAGCLGEAPGAQVPV